MRRIVPFEERSDRFVCGLEVSREDQRIADVVMPGVHDSGIREGKQFLDGVIKSIQIAGETGADGSIEKGVAGDDGVFRLEADRVLCMPRCVNHLDLFTTQVDNLTREQGPVVDGVRPGPVDQPLVSGGMIRVLVGIGDGREGESLRLNEGTHLIDGAAVHGERTPIRVQEIPEIIRPIAKLPDAHAIPSCHRQPPLILPG